MNDPEHRQIVNIALTAAQAAGDAIPPHMAKEALAYCMLPDQVAIPLLRRQKGPWQRYFPRQMRKFNFEQDQRDIWRLLPQNRFYVRHVLRSLRRGDFAAAGRFLGIYAHYIGDFAQPAHYYELHIANLLPPPASWRNCNYHRLIEDIPSQATAATRPAKVLATNAEEMIFRLAQPFAALYRQAIAAVLPMLRAIYARRLSQASRALTPVVQSAGILLGDIWLTLWRLGRGLVTKHDRRRLNQCSLVNMPPRYFDAEFNFGHMPLRDWITRDETQKAERLCLRMGDGAVRPVRGICAIPHALPIPGVEPHSFIEYLLPPKIFSSFTARVGLLAACQRQAPSSFAVIGDGRELWQSPFLTPGDAARDIDIDISDIRRLRLLARTDGSADRLAYPIWGMPCLHK